MSVKFGELVRGNWIADNSNDADRKFDITAEVQVTGEKKVTSMVNGRIFKDDESVGSFSMMGLASIPAFTPQTSDAMMAIEAYQAVISFAADVASEAIENPPFNA